MTSRKTARTAAIGLVALLVIALPAAALAAATASFPKLKTTLIVPNKQLGPIKLGASYKATIHALGTTAGGGCKPQYGCGWGPGADGTLTFSIGSGHQVVVTYIAAPYNDATEKYAFTGPLMKLHTAKGIRLGSTAAQVRHAYPHAKSYNHGTDFQLAGSGPVATRRITSFVLTGGRVTEISLQIGPTEG